MWEAEPKHPNEQKKLTEIGRQIQDERERSEFRLLQEQAGLVTEYSIVTNQRDEEGEGSN